MIFDKLSSIKSGTKNLIAGTLAATDVALLNVVSSFSANNTPTTATTDAFQKASNASNTLKNELWATSRSLFPLAVLILAISLLFTHDEKRLKLEIKLLIGCCVTFAIIYYVSQGAGLENTITTIVG